MNSLNLRTPMQVHGAIGSTPPAETNEVDREVNTIGTAHEHALTLISELRRRLQPVSRNLDRSVSQSSSAPVPSPVCHSQLANRLQVQASNANDINTALNALLEDVVL